jgi:hypothetical protein
MKREPDVEIAAAVRARELRFECKPDVQVGAHANAPATAESVAERENAPDEFQEGITYHDVAVRWRLAARLEDPDLSKRDPI